MHDAPTHAPVAAMPPLAAAAEPRRRPPRPSPPRAVAAPHLETPLPSSSTPSSSLSPSPPSSPAVALSVAKTEDVAEAAVALGPPRKTFSVDSWIVQYHDAWSRLTLSTFYQDLEEHSLTPGQFARWLLDRSSISMAVLEGATRTSMTLQGAGGKELALLHTAKENAQFLMECTTLNGLDVNAQYRMSHPARRLVDLIEASTAPDASPVVAVTAVWGYMLSSWQGWTLCKRRGRAIPQHFKQIADFLTRDDAIWQLIATQGMLDGMLVSEGAGMEFEKAGKTFEEIARRSCAVLDHTLYMGEGSHVPLCICGRKGHLPAQCTFKSHI